MRNFGNNVHTAYLLTYCVKQCAVDTFKCRWQTLQVLKSPKGRSEILLSPDDNSRGFLLRKLCKCRLFSQKFSV